ncbi:hypothetical protein BDN72DRAFT_864529 [Pluteus cervinus]|uniref:Uncharacterized protein n=1 Tax=Pluteus cervinus TaxID=181527 RepID=A0ACD3A3L2_9AGAR|nr:hypothetical protein BDN72DRAFT_864529 [Pluteus cervinus]
MPKRCFDKDQLAMLQTKVGGFLDAQSRGRGKAYARAVHSEFSKRWPEHEELFPGRRKIKAEDEAKVQLLREKKEGQILSWLHRSSAPRGRLTGRAIQQLVRKHRNKRKRAYQPGEVYNQLYPAKVNAAYEEQKTPDLSKGQRLNLIRKIANELLENESEEVKEEVRAEREKKKNELHAEQEVDSDLEAAAENADSTTQEYIEDLPAIWGSLMEEVGKLCPDWGFQLVAAGPMPKADNKFHVFDIYSGPKSIEGYTLSETLEGFSGSFCAPLCTFVKECFGQKEAREKLLGELKYTITPDSEDSDADDLPSSKSRRRIPTSSHKDAKAFDGEVAPPPRRKNRQPLPSFTDSEEDEIVESSPRLRRPPPLLITPTSDEERDEVSPPVKATPTSTKAKKHDLEKFPLAGADDSDFEHVLNTVEQSAGEPDKSDGEEEAGGRDISGTPLESDQDDEVAKSNSSPVKKRSRHVAFASESDEEHPSKSSAFRAKGRATATAKRLETRQKNLEKKEAAAKAKREEEDRLKSKEEDRLRKIAADEATAKRAEIQKAKAKADAKKGAKTKGETVVVEKEKSSTKASSLAGSTFAQGSEVEPIVSSPPKSTADNVARQTNTKVGKVTASARSRGPKAKPTSDDPPSPSSGVSPSKTNEDAPPRRDGSPAPSSSPSKAKGRKTAPRKRIQADSKDTETPSGASPSKTNEDAPPPRRDGSPAPSPSLSKAKGKITAPRKRLRADSTNDTETAVADVLPAKRARRAPAARDADVSFAPPPRVKRA